tara:strand:+ start:5724 stop:10418 length:4695 start_codon:yes stop_codon:yes gene_type:complete
MTTTQKNKPGSLDKKGMSDYTETQCSRQLYIKLGEHDPRWIQRDIQKNTHFTGSALTLAASGKRYEQKVYTILRRLFRQQTHCTLKPPANKEVIETFLDPRLAKRLHQEVRGEAQLLLEYEWPLCDQFVRRVFGQQPDEEIATLGNQYGRVLRPDIMLLHPIPKGQKAPLKCLLPGGKAASFSPTALQGRFGISILDIKYTPDERVGRRHFAELLFYIHALTEWLHETQLDEFFFVPCHGHGILGFLEEDTLYDLTLDDLLWRSPDELSGKHTPKISPLLWEDTHQLFTHAEKTVRTLWQLAKQRTPIEEIPLCVQPACGRCPFIDDCISTLKGTTPTQSDSWDIRLIPYLKTAVAQQLNEHGIYTVGELLQGIEEIPLGNTPVPLHAEIPALKLRAQALSTQRAVYPEGEHTSLSLPKYIDMALVFNLEVDHTNELVFAFGFYLDTKQPSPKLQRLHNDWWRMWRSVLRGERELQDISSVLDLEALELGWHKGDDFSDKLSLLLQEMERLLRTLEADGVLILRAVGESYQFGSQEYTTQKYPLVRCQYSYVSGGIEPEHEYMLLKNMIQQLHRVMRMCSLTELLVTTKHETYDSLYHENFAGFYWSDEQVDHLRALVERHLPALQQDHALSKTFYELVDWMTPADSGVRHHALHKKMYDLREFVGSSVGLPQIINYTWHQTRPLWKKDFEANPYFWTPHFNQMDFGIWHSTIEEIDTNERSQKESDIRDQLVLKMRTLHEILRHFHKEASDVIPKESKTMSSQDFQRDRRNRQYHQLGSLWQGYHQLNAAISALTNDAARLTWPEQSIAKLQAGKLSGMTIKIDDRDGKDYEVVNFSLLGLSSHMKISVKDRVLLLPRTMRDSHAFPFHNMGRLSKLIVEDLVWEPSEQGYCVTAVRELKKRKEGDKETLHSFTELYALYDAEDWFVYPTDLDVWTGRLALNGDALLRRYQLGYSWLAERLMFLHGLGGEHLEAPKTLNVHAAELYTYAPQLLPQKRDCTGEDVLTPIRFRPDSSQQEGILHALSSSISCLQGPPGTGKSQTIIALIDEFIDRHKGPARILISAFSYSALQVVVQKLLDSRYGDGPAPDPTQLSDASRLPIFYASSSESESFVHDPNQQDVMHLSLSSKGVHLDGERIDFRRGSRKDKIFERMFAHKGLEGDGSFVLFANAHTLYHLGTLSKANKRRLVHEDFGFDLIIIDEASQMPASYFTAIAQFVHPFEARLVLPKDEDALKREIRCGAPELSIEGVPSSDDLTHVVLVGDQEQLPPVQQIEPPRKLKPMLDSVFRYFLEVHHVPKHQLSYNYRSHKDIVRCVRRLAIYDQLHAFHQDDAYLSAIPDVLPDTIEAPWLRQLLGRRQVVSTLIHGRQWDTALSPFEAKLTADVVLAFFAQMGVDSDERERQFWQEDVGVVSPHNAHGRLIVREIAERLLSGVGARTYLPETELMECLSTTVYSVEKFQGSDRRLIVGSVGVSSVDRLAAEEGFLYDMSRLNVLISRAKHKMLLICSQQYLDYVPRDRDVMTVAARVREYAYDLCNESQVYDVPFGSGSEFIELRWMVSKDP